MRNNVGGVIGPGTCKTNRTGDWRYFRPVVGAKCIKCGICELCCPDSCIMIDDAKPTVTIDYFYCKGCGICSYECPKNAIIMEEERK